MLRPGSNYDGVVLMLPRVELYKPLPHARHPSPPFAIRPRKVASSDDNDRSAAGPGAGADADPTGEAPAVVKVSGQCDLVFEPWVVEALQQGT